MKRKSIFSLILFICSGLCFFSGFLLILLQIFLIQFLIPLFSVAIILLLVAIFLLPKNIKVVGRVIPSKKKDVKVVVKQQKHHSKTPFISEEEWKELEEEEDELEILDILEEET